MRAGASVDISRPLDLPGRAIVKVLNVIAGRSGQLILGQAISPGLSEGFGE